MPTSFKVTVQLNIPRDLLWRIRASRALSTFLVTNGALNRLDRTAAKPHPSSPTARTRRQVYVPANLAIPDMIKGLFDDSYVEVTDDQVWDDVVAPFAQRSVVRPGVLADVVSTSLTLSLDADPANKLALPARTPPVASSPSPSPSSADTSPSSSTHSLPPTSSPSSVRDAQTVIDSTTTTTSTVTPTASAKTPPHDEAQCGCLHTLAGQCEVSIPFLGYYVEQAVVANMRAFYDEYPRHFEQFLDMLVTKYGDGTRASLPVAVDALLAEEARLDAAELCS